MACSVKLISEEMHPSSPLSFSPLHQCRAIANGVLGDPGAVDFQVVTFSDRFQVLADNVADVTSITTHTMERDVYQDGAQRGFTFSTTYFYEGLGYAGVPFFVECADNIDVSGPCADLKLCTADGSTWIGILRGLFPEGNLVPTILSEDGFPKLVDGSCNVVAGERHDLGQDYAIANGYTDAYVLGINVLSKEPLAFVTRDDDARWSDIVNWVIQALLSADETGTTQSTAQDMGTFDLLGEEFENLFIRAVEASGNYGEIYARNMESIVPRGGLNSISSGDSGRHYSYPFGSINTIGSTPDGKLREIMDRGELRCGVSSVAWFSRYDYDEWRWVGFDIDYCRALSAAIFSGDPTRVLFVRLTSSQRFNALATGEVDVLSRITTHTLARDILEPTSQVGFTFSAPTYYDGLTYGGVGG
jgi:general L-amino acid transport system substrate-binding protein